jgi:hypothetical protein
MDQVDLVLAWAVVYEGVHEVCFERVRVTFKTIISTYTPGKGDGRGGDGYGEGSSGDEILAELQWEPHITVYQGRMYCAVRVYTVAERYVALCLYLNDTWHWCIQVYDWSDLSRPSYVYSEVRVIVHTLVQWTQFHPFLSFLETLSEA